MFRFCLSHLNGASSTSNKQTVYVYCTSIRLVYLKHQIRKNMILRKTEMYWSLKIYIFFSFLIILKV
jgi:hypothetical protein